MLFTTLDFVFVFLPVVFLIYFALMRFRLTSWAFPWLGLASLVFYGWGDYRLLAVLGVSITVNFFVGNRICATGSKAWLIGGVLFNVGVIGYMKYADFLVSIASKLTDSSLPSVTLGLPLIGISFYTFQQIAWLVDMRVRPEKPRFWDYLLFVCFFPQLIAGPIVHHSEMMPQFARLVGAGRTLYLSRLWSHLAVGLTIFIIGLFKKVVIADSCALIASTLFADASSGKEIGTLLAWGGMLAYTLQIYFDFSGYSDMAVGIARMFGIRLPVNFFSPYKAGSIIEFWRRWHMTLSRWLRDYIYIPLGGNRKGPARRHVNLMATMLIGGLWHGASWTFVLWGGLHGAFLVINHIWNQLTGNRSLGLFGWFLTFLAVVNAWVLFRAPDFATAISIYTSMYSWTPSPGLITSDYSIVLAAFVIAIALPNTYEIMRHYRPVLEMRSVQSRDITIASFLQKHIVLKQWRPTRSWAIVIAALASIYLYVISRSDAYVEFIYFQF